MNKETMINVVNRGSGRVGYRIPEMGIERQFTARENKDISFGELERLTFIPGGLRILKDYLVIRDEEAIAALGLRIEPEYFYTEADVKKLLITGTLDEFLDCLDFAPKGVLEMIKDMSVNLPLNDIEKRDAIMKKMGFNVTKAIEIKNAKFDGETETQEEAPLTRRVAPKTETSRRTEVPKYNVTMIAK